MSHGQNVCMPNEAQGYSKEELDEAQDRHNLSFPPDLIDTLLKARIPDGYDWTKDHDQIRERLEWPFEMLLSDVENGFWWPDFGDRPQNTEGCKAVLREYLDRQPRLIPLSGHRFIPDSPNAAGNPVFSMHGFDTIYYGANLEQWLRNEFMDEWNIGMVKHISFWSDIAEDHETPYSFYQTANPDEFG